MKSKILHKSLAAVALLGALALTSCGETDSEESGDSSSSSYSFPTYSIPEESDETLSSVGAYLTIENQYISVNTAFLDSASPYVEFYDGSHIAEVTDEASYELTNVTNGGTYTATEALDEGLYTATASYTYGNTTYVSSSRYFAVEPYPAEEDAGYTETDPAYAFDETNVMNCFYIEGAGPTVGEVKYLVVPLYFQGVDSWSADELSILEDIYVGEDNVGNGTFYSVQEYYAESSYGRLNLEFDIAEPFQMPMTVAQYNRLNNNYYDYIYELEDAFIEEFVEGRGYDLSDYDSDGDGYVDGIQFVYKADRIDDDLFWNFTEFFDSYNANGVSFNGTRMAAPALYVWANYDWLVYYGYGDSHSLIHETGHMLGIDDYYDYQGREAPAGGSTMMDLNVGDLDSFSKMLLGWSEPYVIDGSSDHFTITLSPFEESGDFILLPDIDGSGYNGTPFDEYLLLSYYTPTGLNEPDSDGYVEYAGYPGYGRGGTYQNAGLQVYHVDARTGFIYENGSYEYKDITETTEYERNTTLYVMASNTSYYSAEEDYRLIEAISADGVDRFGEEYLYSYTGEDSVLFGTGDYHGGDSFTRAGFTDCFPEGYLLNDGEDIDYSFRVLDMDEEGITIRFDRNGSSAI